MHSRNLHLKLEIRPRARGTEVHFPEHTERTDH